MERSEKPEDLSERDSLNTSVESTAASVQVQSQQRIPFYQIIGAASAKTKSYFLFGSVSAFILGALLPILFEVLGQIFDENTDEDEDDYDYYKEVCKVTYIELVLGLLALVTGYLSVFFFVRVGQGIGRETRQNYFTSLIHKDIKYYDVESKSILEVPQQMNMVCEAMEQGTGEKFLAFMETLGIVLVGFGICIERSPQLFLVGLSIGPLELLAGAMVGKAMLEGAVLRQEAYKNAGGISEEALLDIKTVQAHNGEAFTSKRYDDELKAPIAAVSKLGFIEGLGWGLVWASWFLMGVLIFWVSAKWISDERHNWIWGDDIEGPDTIVVFWIMAYVCNLFGNLIPGILTVINAEVAAHSAKEFIDKKPEFVDGDIATEIVGIIEFDEVKFAYPKAPLVNVLKGVSFKLEAKKSYAIVGESGAGKSTIIQLIERFYETTGGSVLIDGQPITTYKIADLRRQIGYVNQEPILFDLSIRENLKMAKDDANDAEIEEALKRANAYDFINSLEHKLEENVGMKGSHLSGGQKQRIAIARAILKKPKILLLDEATSALDNLSEAVVLKALKEITRDLEMTTVTVAQKLSTIRHVHRIIVLENGRVTQEGSHDQLITESGKYQSMCYAQGVTVEDAFAKKKVEAKEDLTEVDRVLPPQEEKAPPVVNAMSLPLARILKMALGYLPLMILGMISAIGAGISFPVFGYIVGKLSYYVLGRAGDEMEDNVQKFAVFILILTAVVFFCFLFMLWSFSLLTAYVTRDLRSRSFFQLLHYEAEFFDKEENNSSILNQNLSSDTEKLNSAGGPLIGVFLLISVALIFGCMISLIWQFYLGLVITATVPFQMFAIGRAYVIHLGGAVHPQHKVAQRMVFDILINLKTVKAYGMEDRLVERHDVLIKQAYDDTWFEGHESGFIFGVGLLILYYAYALAFWFGAYLQLKDQTGNEDILICIYANMMASIGIVVASVFSPGVTEGARAAKRIFEIIDYVPKINSQAEGLKNVVEGPIEFKHVNFKYAGRESTVLDDISFIVGKNQKIGITGASGSGKTTIVQLILRFYDTSSGSVHINGIDVKNYDLKHLRSFISTVGQEPVLFKGSLRLNITFGYKDEHGEDAKDEEVLGAMRQAKVNFTHDLDHDVGVRGQAISGGQKQRVAIARAILRNPTILLLDEATSALDSQTEQDIMATLEEVGNQRTVVLIAHRLSTIRKCDNILVMDAGRVTEQGTHDVLLAKNGHYASLWNSVKDS